MQATCCMFMSYRIHVIFSCMHTLMLHSHKPITCTLHTGTLHSHIMPQTAIVYVKSAFRVCLCACCLCLQCAWWHHSCMEHLFVQLLACGMPVSGMQVWSVCACMCGWHACMQCAACMCVWCAFMWNIGMPGGCIVLVPYLLQNLPTI
jgi:hypothetical protein